LREGLRLVGALANTLPRLEAEFALQTRIAIPLIAIKSHAAPEVEQTYLQASELCERLGRSSELLPLLRGLWNCYHVRGELLKGYDLARQLVALAEEQADGAGPPRAYPPCLGLHFVLPRPV